MHMLLIEKNTTPEAMGLSLSLRLNGGNLAHSA